jgi:hypothetical protein
MAAHFYDHSTYHAASVHVTHATPTASAMDPQTFRSTTPLTQHPYFYPLPSHQPTPFHACPCLRSLFTPNDDHDNDPRPTSLTPAPPSHIHSLSLDLTHQSAHVYLYSHIPETHLPTPPPYLDLFVYVPLALIFSVEKID